MDFFEAQEAARKRTFLLVLLFGAAVIAIITVIYLVARVAFGTGTALIDPVLLLQVAVVVGIVIALGSAIRTASLRSGGPAVAELLGGRRISTDTTDLEERRLMNVVEEMSIASGVPVPAVYVLDGEDGINAFAAGHSIHDAAVAVTRGGLRAFNRDELQGVIAHEFSHILNGDMRLNIRLMGVLYGILLLAIIGRGILYAGPRGGSRSRNGGGGYVVILGLALLVVGYIGVFFGKLIKAAVSRQREFLADSAAVQFTRNPDGLAGALKKIGGASQGSRIQNHHAEELSHLFFANGVRGAFAGMLSTHPPLEQRIRRLDPSWKSDGRSEQPSSHMSSRVEGTSGLVGSAGAPRPEHIAYAARLLDGVPTDLNRALHQPLEARAAIFALAAAGSGSISGAERQILDAYGGPELTLLVEQLMPLVLDQGSDARLPLLDLALPALQNMSPDEAADFRAALARMIQADGTVRMFEFALMHTLARRLNLTGDQPRGGRVRSLDRVRSDVEVVLSAVAWSGNNGDAASAEAAFAAGARHLSPSAGPIRLLERGQVGLPRVDQALTALEQASPGVQKRFLEACAETVSHDGRIEAAEAEALRAIAESLDCPIPPLLGAAGTISPSVR
ncbi:M48 family metallopeptidase [soil metagenome]